MSQLACNALPPRNILVKRRQVLSRELKNLGVDGLLVTDILNVRYLTGFTGSSAQLLVTRNELILMSDTRYTTQIEIECGDLTVDIRTAKEPVLTQVARQVELAGICQLGVESESMTRLFYSQLAEKLPKIALVDTNALILNQRAIKDAFEISMIRQSLKVAEKAISVTIAELTESQTEVEIARNLEYSIRKFGGEGCAFEPIVAVGPHAALPHARPTQVCVTDWPFLLIDWGAKFNGYASDLTRIFVTGKISAKLKRVYECVLTAQQLAIQQIRPGRKTGEIDLIARTAIEEAGFGKYFGHGLGHGFGLQIHEQPRLAPNDHTELKAGMVVTVEPGIYLPDWGGVRIEDDILVTPSGYEILSGLTRELEACTVDMLA
ncbi:MAG TPA: Xaa-Pro peptidase family protein [Pirellulaceae bacterium]|nr:Xaa-Pro peptidase family protein [Pirellulaceae bacterium]HMO91569.1 Xaa-Pro peptidase family protein [Pirellulaceae bacterium]HMP68266.1 Xaa-Pro peptidase family protein [Pirellulaceae bacterium]